MSTVNDGVLNVQDSSTFEQPPIWKEKRARWFHRCHDSKKVIWPGQKAHYSDAIEGMGGLQIRTPSVSSWITNKAYVYRKLKGKDKEAVYHVTDVNLA